MSTAIKHPVSDRIKPSFLIFVIFDIRALWRSGLSVRVPNVKNCKWRLNPVWHRMLYSCTHTATLGVKGFARDKYSYWPMMSQFQSQPVRQSYKADVTRHNRDDNHTQWKYIGSFLTTSDKVLSMTAVTGQIQIRCSPTQRVEQLTAIELRKLELTRSQVVARIDDLTASHQII